MKRPRALFGDEESLVELLIILMVLPLSLLLLSLLLLSLLLLSLLEGICCSKAS